MRTAGMLSTDAALSVCRLHGIDAPEEGSNSVQHVRCFHPYIVKASLSQTWSPKRVFSAGGGDGDHPWPSIDAQLAIAKRTNFLSPTNAPSCHERVFERFLDTWDS